MTSLQKLVIFFDLNKEVYKILKHYWGYDEFRSMQLEIVQSVIDKKDTIALLPTGGGKSLCFQLPILTESRKMAVVISPLIALMQDQVTQLKQRDIPAVMLSSSVSRRDNQIILENCIQGAYKFLYISPERLVSIRFLEYFYNMPVSYIAIDESHCISQWGHDFRPAYMKIADIRERLTHIPFVAVTATANNNVLEDIKLSLKLKKPQLFKKSFARDNIAIVIKHSERKIEEIIHMLKHIDGTGIIYVRNRRKTQELAEAINIRGFKAMFYHAGLDHEERQKRQTLWQKDQIKLMVCTNAFGMGIDKSNVRFVIHIDVPPSIEEYYQEIGRGGRDGQKSYAIALINSADLADSKKNLSIHEIKKEELQEFYSIFFKFLNIAVYTGIDHEEQIDVNKLSLIVKKPIYRVIQYLEELESLGVIEISSKVNYFNSVRISEEIDKFTFIKDGSNADKIIKAILRRYAGVFHKAIDLDMFQLENATSMHRQNIISELVKLDTQKVLTFYNAGGDPVITVIQDRVPHKQGVPSLHLLKQKNKMKHERLDAIIGFFESEECRQVYILRYFDELGAPCGKCDYCLANRSQADIRKLIIKQIKAKKELQLTDKQILLTFPQNKRDQARQILKDEQDSF